MMKACLSCGQSKPLDAFAKNGKSGLHPRCKVCMAAAEKLRRIENGDKIRAADRARHQILTASENLRKGVKLAE